jgi:hypothetical protein
MRWERTVCAPCHGASSRRTDAAACVMAVAINRRISEALREFGLASFNRSAAKSTRRRQGQAYQRNYAESEQKEESTATEEEEAQADAEVAAPATEAAHEAPPLGRTCSTIDQVQDEWRALVASARSRTRLNLVEQPVVKPAAQTPKALASAPASLPGSVPSIDCARVPTDGAAEQASSQPSCEHALESAPATASTDGSSPNIHPRRVSRVCAHI